MMRSFNQSFEERRNAEVNDEIARQPLIPNTSNPAASLFRKKCVATFNEECLGQPRTASMLIPGAFAESGDTTLHELSFRPWGRPCVQSPEEGLKRQRDSGFVTALSHLQKQSGLPCPPKRRKEDVKEVVKEGSDLIVEHFGGELNKGIVEVVLSMKLEGERAVVQEDEIAGLEDVKKLIRDKIINPIRRPDLHHGLFRPPKGILLFGPPGTGKTTLARWIASASQASFFEVTPSALISKYYGETESLVRTLFLCAQYFSPCVIFIDEADSLLGRRRDRDDDASIRMKNQLLQMIDGGAALPADGGGMVVVVAATNRPQMLDDAALRRLQRRILVPLPDLEARVVLMQNLIRKHNTEEGSLSAEDLREVARELEGWSGSDLKSLCSKAADFSYDETVAKFGGVENIPDASVFRPIEKRDLVKALPSVRKSFHDDESDQKTERLEQWSRRYGCF